MTKPDPDYPSRITASPRGFCKIRGCRDRRASQEGLLVPREAVPGADMCWHHVDAFSDALTEFLKDEEDPNDSAGLYKQLQRSVVKGRTARFDDTTVDTSGKSDVGSLWNEESARVLGNLHGFIQAQVQLVNEDRPKGPHIQDPAEPLLQLAVLVKFHARWLALYPHLGPDLYREVQVLHRQAMAAIDSNPVRRIVLHGRACSQVETHPEFGEYFCGGQLFGVIRTPDDPRARIVCSSNPDHVIDKALWMEYADA